jgi:hypothetical protein
MALFFLDCHAKKKLTAPIFATSPDSGGTKYYVTP